MKKTTILFIFLFLIFGSFSYAQASTKTLYAWVKDASGNVSNSLSDTVDITLPADNTYYVSSSEGLDTNSGTSSSSPWKTIAKVNAQIFKAGDSILFKKGDTWTGETITVNSSGTASLPITYSSYGSGNQPLISGLTTVSGWTSEGNGIYSKVISAQSAPNIVTVDGNQQAMGRWPNTGWLTYESFVDDVSITDDQLTNTPNWTGAKAVVRRGNWTLDIEPITNHSNSKLTVTVKSTTWDFKTGYGYFIQDDIKTLDQLGEWYYNPSTTKFYMYFGGVNPTTKTVNISTIDKGLYSSNKNYVTVDGIAFEGLNNAGIQFSGTQFIVQNCSFNNSLQGTYIDNLIHSNANLVVDNNTFTNITDVSINILGKTNTAWVKNNTILNNGIIKGAGATNNDGSYDAISVNGPNSIVEYNTITNVGHSAIVLSKGDNDIARFNYIKNFGLTRYDAGGIYSWNASGTTVTSRIITNNIIDGSNKISEGVAGSVDLGLHGLYLDENSQYTLLQYNVVTNCNDAGINNLNSALSNISNNTSYNNGIQLRMVHAWNYGQAITGMNISNNLFVSKIASQPTLFFRDDSNPFSSFGSANNNYYARPIEDNLSIVTSINSFDTNRNLSDWQTLSGKDLNSHTSPISITDVNDLRFEYNANTSNKTVSLGTTNYIDVTGATYTGNITLLPYTSIVLIRTN